MSACRSQDNSILSAVDVIDIISVHYGIFAMQDSLREGNNKKYM